MARPSGRAGNAVLLNVARRQGLAPPELAAVIAGLQPLVAQLTVDLDALRSALSGPDPQFALRVACDVRDALEEQLLQAAAAVRHLAALG